MKWATTAVFFGLVSIIHKSTTLIQPVYGGLTQRADVACWKSGSQHTLTFYLDTKTDTVDLVYTVNDTDPYDVSVGIFDSNSNGIEGSGTSSDPYKFNITATGDLPNTGLTLDEIHADIRNGYVTVPDVVSVNVMAKSMYRPPPWDHLIFQDDVLYTASCNFTDVRDEAVTSGQLTVLGTVAETPDTLEETPAMRVFKTTGSIASSVSLGEQIFLSINPRFPTRAIGLYAHTCNICDQSDCSGVSLPFIGPDGCSLTDTVPGFRRAGQGALSGPFAAFVLSNQNFLHFRCLVNFCYQTGDARCINYCNFNTSGRKKRQAENVTSAEDTLVTAYVRITDVRLGSQEQEISSQMENMALVIGFTTVAILLCMGLIVSIIVYRRSSVKSRSMETET